MNVHSVGYLVVLILALALAGTACDTTSRYATDTGLRGLVLRGPIAPVCQQDAPCDDAPFAATFDVRRDNRRVATFTSGADGRFDVALAPGTYVVVPQADAPLLDPQQQGQTVLVEGEDMTEVTLHFDTGIR